MDGTDQLEAVLSAAELQRLIDSGFSDGPTPFVVEAADGRFAWVRRKADQVQIRPGGTVSGPTLMAMADCAAWVTTMAAIGPETLSVTSQLSIQFLRKPPPGGLAARAELLHLGRRQSVCDVRITSDVSGELVAQATVTYTIPSKRTSG